MNGNLAKQKIERKYILNGIFIAAFLSGIYLFACWYSVSSSGSDKLLAMIALPLLAGFSIVVLWGVLLNLMYLIGWLCRIMPINKKRMLYSASFCGAFFMFGAVAIVLGNQIRLAEFRHVVEKGDSITKAIKKYESVHGTPPNRLEDLVPGFIPSVPPTGMAAYPVYTFVRNETPLHYTGNSWVLLVPVPIGSRHNDWLAYFPNGKYPKRMAGVYVRRIGEWGYIMLPGGRNQLETLK
jgi:hypothetical protein